MEKELAFSRFKDIFEMRQESIAALFGHHEGSINEKCFPHLIKRVNHVMEFIGAGSKVLDFGCGFGLYSVLFGLNGNEVYGIDSDAGRIDSFQRLIRHLGLDNVKAQTGDVPDLGYADGFFDSCFANEILSHVRDLEPALSEISRVLKRGGAIYIADGNNSISIPAGIRRRRLQERLEDGNTDDAAFKTSALTDTLLNTRKKIIKSQFGELKDEVVAVLAKKTKGMYDEQIIRACRQFINDGEIKERADFPFRNPIGGEKMEYPLNPFKLRAVLTEKYGFECRVLPQFISSPVLWKNALGKLIGMTHPVSLLISPFFEIVGIKR